MDAALHEMRRHHEAMKALETRLAQAIRRAEEDDAALELGTPEVGVEDDNALLLEHKSESSG